MRSIHIDYVSAELGLKNISGCELFRRWQFGAGCHILAYMP